MATTLTYHHVAVREVDALVVGFADVQYQTQAYLMLQNYLEMEGEEDEIYIERDAQEQGIYGGIERFVLSGHQAFLWLTPETARAIDTEPEVHIEFEATEEKFQELKAMLERIFARQPIFEVDL